MFGGPSPVAEEHFTSLGYSSVHKTVHIVDFMLDVVIRSTDSEVQVLVDTFANSEAHRTEAEISLSETNKVAPIQMKKHRATFLHQLRYV